MPVIAYLTAHPLAILIPVNTVMILMLNVIIFRDRKRK